MTWPIGSAPSTGHYPHPREPTLARPHPCPALTPSPPAPQSQPITARTPTPTLASTGVTPRMLDVCAPAQTKTMAAPPLLLTRVSALLLTRVPAVTDWERSCAAATAEPHAARIDLSRAPRYATTEPRACAACGAARLSRVGALRAAGRPFCATRSRVLATRPSTTPSRASRSSTRGSTGKSAPPARAVPPGTGNSASLGMGEGSSLAVPGLGYCAA